MRSSIIAAAFAVTVLAVPMENPEKRAVVTNTDVEMVYVTDYVTVTAQGEAPAPAPTKESDSNGGNYHWGHKPHWWTGPHKAPAKQHTKQPQPEPEPTQTWEQPTKAPTHAPPHTPTHAPTTWSEPAPEPSSPSQPPPSQPSDYKSTVLYHHNLHRRNHTNTPDVQWSDSLAATAAQIAATCKYEHSMGINGGGYGQNIAAGVDNSGIDRVITNMFYNAEVGWFAGLYGQASPSVNFEHWGHFSQMVWANTDSVACVTQHCPGGLANTGGNVSPYFTVCNYSPPGNVANQYADNVHDSKDEATVTA